MQRPSQYMLAKQNAFIAAITVVLCVLAILLISTVLNAGNPFAPAFLLALALGASVVIADLDPIQLAPHFKVSITTVPLFLMAALLPPPLAGLSAASSMLIAELLSRSKRLRLPSEIAFATIRWGLVVLLSSLVLSFSNAAQTLYSIQLVIAAAIMFVTDVLSSALELAWMSKQSYWQTVFQIGKEAIVIEGVQYTLGIIGALAAMEQVWVIVLLILPALMIHWGYRTLKETHPDLEKIVHSLMSLYPAPTSSQSELDSTKFFNEMLAVRENYYEILEVAPNARPEIITSAYKQLTRLYHPDLHRAPENAHRMKIINTAYEVLSDPIKRQIYDRSRQPLGAGAWDGMENVLDPHVEEIVNLLEFELHQGCKDDTVSGGLEKYVHQWANGLATLPPELCTLGASVAAFLEGYSRMTQWERIQAVLQALARAQGRPVPFFGNRTART